MEEAILCLKLGKGRYYALSGFEKCIHLHGQNFMGLRRKEVRQAHCQNFMEHVGCCLEQAYTQEDGIFVLTYRWNSLYTLTLSANHPEGNLGLRDCDANQIETWSAVYMICVARAASEHPKQFLFLIFILRPSHLNNGQHKVFMWYHFIINPVSSPAMHHREIRNL